MKGQKKFMLLKVHIWGEISIGCAYHVGPSSGYKSQQRIKNLDDGQT